MMKLILKLLIFTSVIALLHSCNSAEEFYLKPNLSFVEGDTSPPFDGGSGNDSNNSDDSNDTNNDSNNNQQDPVVNLEDTSDEFQQNSASQGVVDILWVVDDSPSMKNEQALLARNFNIFINDFITENVDFQMAITTTDPRHKAGDEVARYRRYRLQPKNKIINGGDGKMFNGDHLDKLNDEAMTDDQEQFMRNFKKLVKVGIKGYWKEQGLRTSKRFFERNASKFLREDANLAIIYVSDEKDGSPESVQAYYDFLTSLKASADMVKVYSIVNIQKRYTQLSQMTNGLSFSLKEDFGNLLGDIGKEIVNLTSGFKLSKKPYDASKIKVFVDGQEVTSGYEYSEDDQFIKFSEDSIPSVGSSIKVEYQVEK